MSSFVDYTVLVSIKSPSNTINRVGSLNGRDVRKKREGG